MLEEIRIFIMQRLVAMNKLALNLEDTITPSIRKQLEKLKEKQREWLVIPSGFQELEVRKGDESYGVDLMNKEDGAIASSTKKNGKRPMSTDMQSDEITPPPSKQKKDKAPPLPFRIYVKNKGRLERIANQKKLFKFDDKGTGSTPDLAFDCSS
ncbi:hypothetical protein Tco_1434437 [Tanacetum coccineum]